MNKITLLILLIIVTSCNLKQRQKDQTNELEMAKAAITEFEFLKEIHNFGKMEAGEIAIYNFAFKNTGKRNLVFKKIEKGCGCLKATTKKKSYPPDSEGFVEVTFDTSGLHGKEFKSVTLHVNTQEQTKQLSVYADITNSEIVK